MQEQKKREAYRCLVIITDSHIREQLCEFLADSHIPVYYQMHGIGTASSEWLELCGLGSIQKSITLCFIPNGRKKILLAEMNQALSLHKKGTGIAVSIPMNGMQGFLYKLLNEHTAESDGEEVEKEVKKMSEPITHAMILVTINQGYSDAVMNTARAAGATGGTILKGLRCSPGKNDSFGTGGYMGDFAIDGLKITGVSTVEQVEAATGEVIAFADMSSGSPTAWQWAFPGGTPSTSTDQNPRVFYTRDGVYDVTLTVSNADGSDTKTRTGFVKVTGSAPLARILPPATFRFSETRLPMVAPLVGVQYRDNSTNYPTSWEWTFDGVDPEPYARVTSHEENPIVGYSYMHKQGVSLRVENEHGESNDTVEVSVEYSGLITNLEPGDRAATFDLEDRGTFPGTNKLNITAYAEKFSKPSRPILVFGAYVYFVSASAASITDQIADVGVHLYTSENGLPGKKLDSMWWRVFELETPSGSSLTATEFEFDPTVIDDEFFIVVDGIPEKNDSVDVSFAMADFRDHGNTAYMLKDGEWRDVSTYFPAGANHTSYMIMPSIVHSVMSPMPVDREPLVVGKAAGTVKYPFYSIYGYETPIRSDAEWCRVVGKPNGLTLDTLQISYDRLPDGIEERVATLTVSDSISTYDIKVTQNVNGVSSVEKVTEEKASIYPSVFNSEFIVRVPENTRSISVLDEGGREVYRQHVDSQARLVTVDASAWAPGTYFIRVVGKHEITVVKGVKR